jgi:hypothetical protein
MIALTRLKRAIADVPTGGMQTGDPKVRLKLCDAQRIEVEFNAIIAERDAALAQLVAVKEGGGTGQSPCAKFCESVATWKDFYQLREHSDRLHVENCDIKRVNAELVAQVEQLKGIKPELPPFPPQGDGLPRFGIKWNGEYEPISTPMDDGYWTPYHLAMALLQSRPSIADHLVRQIAFSLKAFGPALRTGGVIDHIRKELKEVEDNPHDLYEWIDIAMLALDGAWRHAIRDGRTNEDIAQEVAAALQAKLVKNENRTWPDWRLLSEDKAIEHDRTGESAGKVGEQ